MVISRRTHALHCLPFSCSPVDGAVLHRWKLKNNPSRWWPIQVNEKNTWRMGILLVKAVYRLIMDEGPKKSHSWIYFLQHFLICMGNFGVSPRYPQMVSLPGMVPSGHTVTSVFRGGDDRNQFDQLSSSWSGRGGEFNWEALLEGQIKGPMWSFCLCTGRIYDHSLFSFCVIMCYQNDIYIYTWWWW